MRRGLLLLAATATAAAAIPLVAVAAARDSAAATGGFPRRRRRAAHSHDAIRRRRNAGASRRRRASRPSRFRDSDRPRRRPASPGSSAMGERRPGDRCRGNQHVVGSLPRTRPCPRRPIASRGNLATWSRTCGGLAASVWSRIRIRPSPTCSGTTGASRSTASNGSTATANGGTIHARRCCARPAHVFRAAGRVDGRAVRPA